MNVLNEKFYLKLKIIILLKCICIYVISKDALKYLNKIFSSLMIIFELCLIFF